MEHVGLILGIEMSRIARNNKDWHNLLEMCAVFGAILADEDGVYDPQDTNDRLSAWPEGDHQRIRACYYAESIGTRSAPQGPAR